MAGRAQALWLLTGPACQALGQHLMHVGAPEITGALPKSVLSFHLLISDLSKPEGPLDVAGVLVRAVYEP